MRSSLAELASSLTALDYEALEESARRTLSEILLDAFGCAASGATLDPYPGLLPRPSPREEESLLWFRSARTSAAEAALVNGTIAHHAEMDDGLPAAGVHGGVTVVPAALAVAELTRADGRRLLEAIACGYGAALACGEPLLAGIERHRLHPPGLVGSFGAAAAAGRLLSLSEEKLAEALALAGTLLPLGPFESFPKGAPVKDLYGGWPAHVGIRAAGFARAGISGPPEVFTSERDGLGRFLEHGPVEAPAGLDVERALDVYIKPFACCRALHSALSALERLLPIAPEHVASVRVETYGFAAELSAEADVTTPIGAKTSLPYAVSTLLIDGRVEPDAYRPDVLAQPDRIALANRVTVSSARLGARRASRVTVVLRDGSERTSACAQPRSETDLRAKLHRLAGPRAASIRTAVERLPEAPDLSELVASLEAPL